MDILDDDIVSLLVKRAYDIAGVTSSKVKVYLNGKQIKVKDFEAYCDLYL
jgi:DNA topoisomerase-2